MLVLSSLIFVNALVNAFWTGCGFFHHQFCILSTPGAVHSFLFVASFFTFSKVMLKSLTWLTFSFSCLIISSIHGRYGVISSLSLRQLYLFVPQLIPPLLSGIPQVVISYIFIDQDSQFLDDFFSFLSCFSLLSPSIQLIAHFCYNVVQFFDFLLQLSFLSVSSVHTFLLPFTFITLYHQLP